MHILLKTILKEIEEPTEETPLKVQIYCDMDGVLVDLDKGFKKVSGGLSPEEYEKKNGKGSFWKIVNKHPNFWIDLEPKADAKILWEFIKENFKDPAPVLLSAGQGSRITQQKTQWIHKHIDASAKVIIAPSGVKKKEYIIQTPSKCTHVLVDDTPKNIEAWNDENFDRIAILHKDAAKSIEQLKSFLPQ